MSRIFAISLAVIALSSYVAADAGETTIIVPFGDPQAISADILGVDSKGRTTWQLRQGAYTGTWTDPQGSFPGTATLVEGADYASYTYAVKDGEGDFMVAGECSIGGGQRRKTDTVTPFGVQVAATGVPAGGSGGGASGNPSATGGANSGSGVSPSAPSSTQPSSSIRTSASGFGALAGLLLASYLF
ncbi:hypothetical protein MVEN_02627500 [Mycena venus]|uniref:Uncharacterized protein n=1 Tax=Mycena venus TaxID=2733690 RepID=A0A8H6WPZ7_9AGAR|nr:hypothetical protein MVEN_02627500 [Mycena venus]